MELQAIILAGGKSSRMGTDKGLLRFQGKIIVEHLIETCKVLTDNILIVSQHSDYTEFGVPVFADIIPEKGPLGGLYTGLTHSNSDLNLVLPCDYPLISVEIIEFLLENHSNEEVLFLESNGKQHPMPGLYMRKLVPKLKDPIEKGKLKLMDFIRSCDYRILECPEQLASQLKNVNTMNEFENLKHADQS